MVGWWLYAVRMRKVWMLSWILSSCMFKCLSYLIIIFIDFGRKNSGIKLLPTHGGCLEAGRDRLGGSLWSVLLFSFLFRLQSRGKMCHGPSQSHLGSSSSFLAMPESFIHDWFEKSSKLLIWNRILDFVSWSSNEFGDCAVVNPFSYKFPQSLF